MWLPVARLRTCRHPRMDGDGRAGRSSRRWRWLDPKKPQVERGSESGHGGHGHLLKFHGRAWLARLPVRTRTVRDVRPRRSGGRKASVTLAGARPQLVGVSGRPVAAWFRGVRRLPGHFRKCPLTAVVGGRADILVRRPPAAAGRPPTAGPQLGGRRPGPPGPGAPQPSHLGGFGTPAQTYEEVAEGPLI
jgi:hypothetical protein